VTQQYIVGEFSSLLGDLQRIPSGHTAAIRELRREVECSPLQVLPRLAREAMNLADTICLAALEQGDVDGFRDCARTAAALGDFTDNACLLLE
jgi:hypothetical protein